MTPVYRCDGCGVVHSSVRDAMLCEQRHDGPAVGPTDRTPLDTLRALIADAGTHGVVSCDAVVAAMPWVARPRMGEVLTSP